MHQKKLETHTFARSQCITSRTFLCSEVSST